MKFLEITLALMVAVAAVVTAHASEPAAPKLAAEAAKTVIVLVDGAFADGSSWDKVIPLLEKRGYTVIAVQNPLTSLADDVATTKRVIDAQKGPIIVVGHSYGGTVITSAASGNAHVKGLVYIAAFAPDAGETMADLGGKFAAPPLNAALAPDAAGFLYIDRAKFHDVFCADATDAEADVMAATQKPVAASVFAAPTVNPAWRAIPSWYMVSGADRAINPDLERFMAKRMGAKTVEANSSHVPFVSQPQTVASLIEQAARAAAH